MTKTQRPGRTNPITNRMQRFEDGDLVHITINPSIQKGQPAPRFHGKTGKVTGQKGKAYIVSLKEGNKAKEFRGLFSYESYSKKLLPSYPTMSDPKQLARIIKTLVNNEEHKIVGNE